MDLGITIPAAQQSFDPIPKGIYRFEIVKSEYKTTRAKGQMLAVAFKILGPTNIGRRVFANFNLVNDNEEVVEKAKKELSALIYACDLSEIRDSDELIGCECRIDIDIRKSNKNPNELENYIRRYYKLEESQEKDDTPF